ncbi:MAG: CDGSH iron-sulfur domain-containing protein [Gaiellaceae bacterium MAG52_C11]|nr:CDGSH iron-sulfur domain-containing protein [Candidatus Gaiellasilicea maunaloa]
MQATLPTTIVVQPDGPYLATNAAVVDWLGVEVPARPQLALCRCGQSQLKPFCDGTHAEIGFSDKKDPAHVPDQRDSYAGQLLTVLDNRALCSHSGFCSDRLATVFHVASDPFVTPSAGRIDETIRAVRDCPSGTLSFALGDLEARAQVDQERAPQVEVAKDGPYRVTGAIPLLDADGEPVARNEGASFEHYSLCRCGSSRNKPFCSGMHFYADFHDPPPPDREPTLFEWAGGFPALERMTRRFYERFVPEDPLLGPLFSEMAPDHPERVAAWLGEVFGGPPRHSELYGGYDQMVAQHLSRALSEEQRARWVQLMCRAADDVGLPADAAFRAAFAGYLEWGSRIAKENSTPDAAPPKHMPVPHWWWVCNTAPGARPSSVPEPKEEQVTLPPADEPVAFAQIKPLFRQQDRVSMRFAFDLWAYDDVNRNAEAILERVRAGSMPCDGAWPAEKVDVFARWVAAGKPE